MTSTTILFRFQLRGCLDACLLSANAALVSTIYSGHLVTPFVLVAPEAEVR